MEILTRLSADETQDQCTATVNLGAKIRMKIRTIVRRREIIQTMF